MLPAEAALAPFVKTYVPLAENWRLMTKFNGVSRETNRKYAITIGGVSEASYATSVIVTLGKDDIIYLREKGRRKGYYVGAAALLRMLAMKELMK